MSKYRIQVVCVLVTMIAASSTWAASAPPSTSLNNCQNAVKAATASFIKNKVAAIGSCLQAVSTQIVKSDAPDASRAAHSCATQFRKLNDSRGQHKQFSDKLAASIVTKCDPSYQTAGGSFPNTHTVADIIGSGASVPQPLDAENLNTWCSKYGGGAIASLQDWIDCITAAAECGVDSAIASQYPRVIEWLNLVRTPMQALSAPGSDPTKISDAVAGLDALKAEIDGPDNDDVVSIQCGGVGATGNATADEVAGGKTFSNSTAAGLTGTMPNNGAVTLTPGTTDQAIAAGYHNGSGKCVGDPDLVSGNIKSGVNLFGVNGSPSVVDSSSATASASDIVSGKTAFVNGNLITGNVTAGGNVNGANGLRVLTITDGLYSGSKTCTANDSSLVTGNIKSGATIFGVAGSSTVVDTSGATAVASDCISGKTAYVNGSLITGSAAGGSNVTGPNGSQVFTIPDALYSGSKTCTASDSNLATGNIKSGATIFGVSGSSTVVDTAGATAVASDFISGKTAYVNGSLVTGSAAAGSNVNGPDGSRTFTIPDALYSGSKTATANDTNLTGSNIANGVVILGVTGTLTGPAAQQLKSGQTLCDQGAGTFGACPGTPAGQDAALSKGLARSYTDNGNGTITDNKTSLMWEKLSKDGTIHDLNNLYTWYTAFTTKITTLNSTSFAGFNDWRVPNAKELESLIDLGRVGPAIDPTFNTACPASCTVLTCSCTRIDAYWSSTTYQNIPDIAWIVVFYDGELFNDDKNTANYPVRAVRGGI